MNVLDFYRLPYFKRHLLTIVVVIVATVVLVVPPLNLATIVKFLVITIAIAVLFKNYGDQLEDYLSKGGKNVGQADAAEPVGE